jgi:hypothetical protein
VVALPDDDTSDAAGLLREELAGIGLWAPQPAGDAILEGEQDASID